MCLISLNDPIYMKLLNDSYISALGEGKYQDAFKLLKIYVKYFIIWQNNFELPTYAWKLNELGKLAHLINKNLKAEKTCV
jgi:hypothetical protein